MECNPADYLTKQEHQSICDKQHEMEMEWAHDAVKHSEEDRNKLWKAIDKTNEGVDELKSFIPKFQWWFIVLLVAIIISSYVMPRLTQNGTHKTLQEINAKVNIIGDTQKEHEKISTDNNERLEKMEKKLGIK